MREYMADNSITYAIIMGDVFHTREAIATDVMNAAYAFFEETKSKYNQIWGAFPGNHDMFLKHSWKITSLNPLSGVLNIYGKESLIEILGQRIWVLPYIHDEDVYMRVVESVSKQIQKDDILLTHVGANGATLNECFLHKNWSVVDFSQLPINVFAGHFHCHQQVGDNLWYPGSPIPFKFDEGLVDHGFIVYDSSVGTHEFVKIYDLFDDKKAPHDYKTMADVSIDDLDIEEIEGNKVRIALGRDYTNDELVDIRNKLMEMGAKSVDWMTTKQKEVKLDEVSSGDVSLGNPKELLKTWLKLDKPDHVDEEVLFKLNDSIVSEGNDILIEQGDA
jgi:DNA repair exonuclease SbcCD nuclease subunit